MRAWRSSSPRPSSGTPKSAPNWPSTSSPSSRRPSTRSRACLRQVEFFETQVKPSTQERQDRLRLGRCPAVRDGPRAVPMCLKDDFDLTLQPAIGTMPTITEIGMAALLPKANESAKVVAVGGGKLGSGGRRHGHQGPQGPGRLPEGPRRRAGLRRQARRPAAQALEEGQGRHPERPAGPGHLAGDRRIGREGQHPASPAVRWTAC